jgi:hypothetical protein
MQAQRTQFQSSKHDLATQALRAAVQFERVIAGMNLESGKIRDLAGELRAKAAPQPTSAPLRLVEPGYLGTYRNLVRSYGKSVKTVQAIQEGVFGLADELEAFANNPGDEPMAVKLRDICLALHGKLLQELSEETPAHEWRRELYQAEAGVGST